MAEITRDDIERAVRDLFTSGDGRRATRLVLCDESVQPRRDLGGWGEKPMADRLCKLLGVERKDGA